MKTKNTFGFCFFLKQNRGKSIRPIYARITINSDRAEFSTKYSIEESDWDSTKGRPKKLSGCKNDDILYSLDSIQGAILNDYNKFFLAQKPVTSEELKNRFLGIKEIADDDPYSVIKLFEYHNTEMKNTLEWGTLKNYFTTQKYFQAYIKKEYRKKDIPLCELNYRFLSGFERYMRDEQTAIDPERPCNNNTIMKHIERFRKTINLAIRNEWLDKDPFVKFQPKFIHKDRDFLTKEELQRIENKKFTIPRLQHVQDLFIFSCYTGLAYIDTINLEQSNVSIGINGKLWLTTSRQKTKQSVRIPLLPKAQEIIMKYKNEACVTKENRLLPTMSNQRLNAYLKEIADCCRISKNLTFHIARHTFATTVTLTNGVPLETVSKLLGHTTIRMTQVYAKVVETKVMDDMEALTDKLEKNVRKLSKAQ